MHQWGIYLGVEGEGLFLLMKMRMKKKVGSTEPSCQGRGKYH